ncbi:hypothetical protein KL950_004597 [Ogataea haglerorum]|nr:hypothetical protein KL950_004597 [Ogataea haglerorum]
MELEKAKQRDLTDSVSRLSVTHERLSKNSDYLHDLTTKLNHRRSRSLDLNDKNSTQNLNTVDEGLMNIELYIGHHKYSRRAVFAAAQAEEAQMGEPQGKAREAAVLGDQQPAELEQRDRGDGGPVPDDTHGGKSARSGAGGEEQAAGQACEPAQVRRRREKIHTADVAHLLHLHQEHVSAVRAVFPRDGTEGDFRWVVERENRCLQQAVQAAADRLQRAVGALPELRKD